MTDKPDAKHWKKMPNNPERLRALADRRIFGIEGDTDEETVMRECATAWEDDRAKVEALERKLDSIASDALWHEGDDVPSEAMKDIRETLHDLGYTRRWAHERAIRQDALDTLAALAAAPNVPSDATSAAKSPAEGLGDDSSGCLTGTGWARKGEDDEA
jgi:hypothetical protein